MDAIYPPPSYAASMIYASILNRASYAWYAPPEAGPSTIGRRLASPLRAVSPSAWSSDSEDDDSEDEADDDDDDYLYRGRPAYRRPVPFALPTDRTLATKTVLPDAALKSPNATFSPIDIPPSPLQLPTTTGPLFPDRPTDSLFSIRTLSVDSSSDAPRRPSSPASVLRRSSSITDSDTSGSGSSSDWDGFSDEEEDGDLDSGMLLLDGDEAVVIRRGSDDSAVDYLGAGLSFARKPSIGLAKLPAPADTSSFSLPSSLQPELSELAHLSTRSRSLRTARSPSWTA